jgi:hypothetical protein
VARLATLRVMSDDERDRMRWLRRNLIGLGFSLAFAGGALFGMLAVSLGLPPVWWAPTMVLLSSGFLAYLNLGRRQP